MKDCSGRCGNPGTLWALALLPVGTTCALRSGASGSAVPASASPARVLRRCGVCPVVLNHADPNFIEIHTVQAVVGSGARASAGANQLQEPRILLLATSTTKDRVLVRSSLGLRTDGTATGATARPAPSAVHQKSP